jgi:hypothetical protein
MRLTLKAVNAELARRGHAALLAKGDEYFYFSSGEASDWLDRTVNVPTLSSLSLDEWLAEFDRLKKLNAEIMKTAKTPARAGKQKQPRGGGAAQTSKSLIS